MALPKVGVEAVVEGMSAFEADSKKVNKALDDMDTGASKLGKGASGLTGHLSSLGTSLLSMGAIAGGAALAGVTALAGGLAVFAAGGIKQAIDLDQQVANIAATMGATRETAGTLKDELKGLALDLSLNPNLTVDVTQAGQAIEVLAANGALATDEFGKLTQASKDLAVQTVALANATGSDFATAATIATDAASIFGLQADEMGKAVDGAAGIMNASKFNANDYALALASGGAVTAGFGVSLEDFNAVIASTASSFSSGSDAGTSFKTLMQRLANPTGKAKDLMNDLGISLFDAEGNFRGMEAVVGQLNEAFGGMTDAQRAQTASIIGGADASRILLALSGQTAEGFDALSESVNRSGQGMEAAALRVDTVKGAMDIFKGVLQAIQIQVGDAFLPLLKELAVNFTQFATEIGPQVVAFFGQVSESIGQIITKGQELFAVFQAEGAGGLLTALGIGPDGIALFEKVSTLITDVATAISTMLMPVLSGITSSGIMDSINTGLTFLNEHFEEVKGALAGIGVIVAGGVLVALGTAIAGLVGPMTLLVGAAALLGAAWMGNWGGIRDTTMAAWAAIQPALTQLVTWLQTNIPVAIQTVSDIWTNTFLPGLTAIGGFITDTLVPAFTTMQTWLKDNIPSAVQTLSDVWTNTLLPALETGFENFKNVLSLLESLGEVINAVLSKALEAMAGLWQNVLWPALKKVGQILKDTLMPAFDSIGKTVKSDVSPALRDFGDSILPMITEGIEFVNEAIQRTISFFKSLAETIEGISLPDWLQTHSPPPLADGLNMIASGAISAGKAIAGMQQSLLSSTANTDRFIDSLNMGGIAANNMLSNWNDVRDILHLNIGANMGRLASGELSGADLPRILGEQAGVWNVPPQMLEGIAEAQGLFAHFSDTFAAFQEQIRIENLGNMLQMASSFSGLGSTFADMLEEMSSMDEINKTIQVYQKLTSEVTTQTNQLDLLKQELEKLTTASELDTDAIEKKQIEIDKLTKKMGENQDAVVAARKNYENLQASAFDLFSGTQTEAERIQSELSTIALLQEFLASGAINMLIPSDAVSQAAGITGILYDQISGQAELNRLLAEQQQREELITQQKEAQQKLGFLQAQLDLIKLGRELGGNIFQGMTFGLNASVTDLLAATNSVVEAMVGQINSDLQIASPSRVMARIGMQMMAGLQGGIASMTPTLASQMSASVAGPLSPAMAGALAGNSSSVTNNYSFPMTVNTSASAQAVVRQYEIERSMHGV